MAYTGKKVHELRAMCMERGLPKEGVKNKLISQLERYDLEKVNIKREGMEIDCLDVSLLIPAASAVTTSSHETSTQNMSQPLLLEVPSPPESPQSMEDSEGSLESIDESLERRDQSEEPSSSLPASATTSPIISNDVAIETTAPITTNNSQQHQTASSLGMLPSSTRQSMLCEFSSHQSSIQSEIDRDLLAQLIVERKSLLQSPNIYMLYNKGTTINQSRNGVQYNYDLLLEIVQSSWIYNDGEIPLWLKEAYDATFGTSYWETSVVSPGIDADEIFLLKDDNQMMPMEYIFLS
ncbi:4441_t:CDS:2 [Acaulospora colombiana]|uniref:4441_t:CDS:1 n=1 Tax=Acaulospora colombiana TaxID=27376 RepID=A0ACA9LGC7_9GLOM|nr:4441_t:CDS:2 [Acaulospora colombiana]